jgi:hypothetical protein
MTGSYERRELKQELRGRLLRARPATAGPGPVAMQIAVTTWPGRNWASLWKPLTGARPRAGRRPSRPSRPHDDRIVSPALHHHVSTGIAHDVIIDAWWTSL